MAGDAASSTFTWMREVMVLVYGYVKWLTSLMVLIQLVPIVARYTVKRVTAPLFLLRVRRLLKLSGPGRWMLRQYRLMTSRLDPGARDTRPPFDPDEPIERPRSNSCPEPYSIVTHYSGPEPC